MKRIIATAVTLLFLQGLSAYAQTHFERMNRGDSLKSDRDKDSNNSSKEKTSSANDQNDNRLAVRAEKAENTEQSVQEKPNRQSARQQVRKVTNNSGNNGEPQGNWKDPSSAGTGSEMRIKQLKKTGKTPDQINRESQGRKTSGPYTGRVETGTQGVGSVKPVSRGRVNVKPIESTPRKVQIPEKVKKLGVTKLPPAFGKQDKILRTDRQRSTIPAASAGPQGKPFKTSIFSPKKMSTSTVKTHMDLIARDKNFHNQILHFNTSEMQPKKYYWHNWNGHSYCHYYDAWGYHWYGWNVGPDFFWTRYYNNNWWWYDPGYDRWCYWYNGWWWWPHPSRVNVVYIYNNGSYTECDSTPEVTTAPITAGDGSEVIYRSTNGNRMVKIAGNENDAFLYDTSGSPAFRAVYLASNVKKAKFSYRDGVLYQVVLLHFDGTYSLFDADGYPYQTGSDDLE